MGKTSKIRYEYEDGSKYIGEYYEMRLILSKNRN